MDEVRKARLTGVVIGVVIAVAVAYIFFWINPDALRKLFDLRQEEDRPPVVVSNGSVKFDVLKGDFKAVTGSTKYRQAGDNEANDPTVTSMDVLVEGSSSPSCANEITNLTEFTIHTTKGSIVIDRLKRPNPSTIHDLAVTFLTNAMKPKKGRLRHLDQDLSGVEFTTGGTTHKCTFDGDEHDRQVLIQPR